MLLTWLQACLKYAVLLHHMAGTLLRRLLTYDSSDDDSDVDFNENDDGQSSRKRRKFIRRDHIEGHERLFRDYFAEVPLYPP